jgi:hypothetical protein
VGRERAEVAKKACFLGGLLEEPYDKEGTSLVVESIIYAIYTKSLSHY